MLYAIDLYPATLIVGIRRRTLGSALAMQLILGLICVRSFDSVGRRSTTTRHYLTSPRFKRRILYVLATHERRFLPPNVLPLLPQDFIFCTLGTGAVVLLIHLIVESHLPSLRLIPLCLSVLCFTYSSTSAIYMLVLASVFKTKIGMALVNENPKSGDIFKGAVRKT